MSERVLYPQWRDQNRETKYPFSDAALLKNKQGIIVPVDLFIDAIVYPLGNKSRMYMSKVIVDYDKATIFIGDRENKERCYGIVPFTGTIPDQVILVDKYQRPAGLLISENNNLLNLASWGSGTHEFTPEETELSARVCVPMPIGGIHGIELEDGTLMTGDVWLVGENGVILEYTQITLKDLSTNQTKPANGIIIHIVGDPLFRRKFCENTFFTPRYIKRIRVVGPNGSFYVTPDNSGNINIYVSNRLDSSTVLRIFGTTSGIIISASGSGN